LTLFTKYLYFKYIILTGITEHLALEMRDITKENCLITQGNKDKKIGHCIHLTKTRWKTGNTRSSSIAGWFIHLAKRDCAIKLNWH